MLYAINSIDIQNLKVSCKSLKLANEHPIVYVLMHTYKLKHS